LICFLRLNIIYLYYISENSTLSKIFKTGGNIPPVEYEPIHGGKTREVYLVNHIRVAKVYKAQPNPGWHKLVENRELAISERRKLIDYYQTKYPVDSTIYLPKSKFNIIEKNGESVVITIEEPMFDIYPGVSNGYIDLCSTEFGANLNGGKTLSDILNKNHQFKNDLIIFLERIRKEIKYPNDKLAGEPITLVLDFYGRSNLLYKDGKFVINNSAFKFDYDGIPISTRSARIILNRINRENRRKLTKDEEYIMRVIKVSGEWINHLCYLCEIPNIYKLKLLQEINNVLP